MNRLASRLQGIAVFMDFLKYKDYVGGAVLSRADVLCSRGLDSDQLRALYQQETEKSQRKQVPSGEQCYDPEMWSRN